MDVTNDTGYVIDSDAFPVMSDGLHFDAAGQQLLGDEFARKTAYSIWMLESFSVAQIDSGEAEAEADPDGDGKSNGEEFLARSNPLSGAQPAMH